jgi:hypothetical protein
MNMQVQLVNKIPDIDGVYLFKFNEKSDLHLVSIITIEGDRYLKPESPRVKAISLSSRHEKVFEFALFSEPINLI